MSIPVCKIKDKLIKQWVPAILVPTPGKINVTFFYANRYSQKQGFESVSGSNICSPPPKPIYNNYKSEITLPGGFGIQKEEYRQNVSWDNSNCFAHIYIYIFYNKSFLYTLVPPSLQAVEEKTNTKTCLYYLCIIL